MRTIFALRLAATIFGLVSILHLYRIISGTSVIIGSCPLPFWVNWAGFFGALTLSVWLFRESAGRKK